MCVASVAFVLSDVLFSAFRFFILSFDGRCNKIFPPPNGCILKMCAIILNVILLFKPKHVGLDAIVAAYVDLADTSSVYSHGRLCFIPNTPALLLLPRI